MRIRSLLLALATALAFSCSADETNNTNGSANNHTNNGSNNTTGSNNTAGSNNNSTGSNNAVSNNSTNQTPGQVPEGALGWELPAAAVEVEQTEFEGRIADGGVVPISQLLLREQKEQRERRAIGDEQTIVDFQLRNPQAKFWFPVADDGEHGDSNLRHTWQAPTGDVKEVTLHGETWAKRTVAEALRTYPTRDNQFALYEQMWNDFPVDLRVGLDLPDPMEVDSSPGDYDLATLRQFVQTMSNYAAELTPDTFDILPQPAGYPATCEDEVGVGEGTDRSGNCSPDPSGLFAVANWPTKWFNTCVKDQGNRGTCVAMSTVSSIEQMVAKRDRQWLNLSEQALYNRMKLQWDREDYWDGFFTALAGSHLKTEGWHVPFEMRWNYNPSPSRVDGVLACKEAYCVNSPYCEALCADNPAWWYYLRSCDDFDEACSDYSHQTNMICYETLEGAYSCGFELPDQNDGGEGHGIGSYGELWDHDAPNMSMTRVLLNLAFERPVVIGVPLYDSFWDATGNGGVMPMPDVANEVIRGAHAMHVLAYVDNSTLPQIAPNVPDGAGGGYLIVKNSWGTCFGDGGYVYMPYDFVVQYVYDAVVFLELQ